jgi:hypothetical protein
MYSTTPTPLRRKYVQDRRATSGIVTGTDDSLGLVEQQIHAIGAIARSNELSVKLDAIAPGIGFLTESSQIAIHAHPSVKDSALGMTARGNPPLGEKFL